MFEDLGKLIITKIELGISVTFPIGLGAVLRGIRVLDYLYVEEKEDYRRSEYTRTKFPAASLDFEAFDALRIRFISRITSYIITVCTIDGILRQSYTHFIKCLSQIGYSSVIPSDDGLALLHQRKEEIKDYLFYRNKVFAHTAFDSPRKDDSRSLQYSSLYYFSGNLIYVKDEYLALGGGSVIVDKEEEPPELSIVKGHPNLREHYGLCEHMFVDILERIPKEELISKVDKIGLM